MQFYRPTAIGLTAILFWSTVVGLIRSVTEALGAVRGSAMIYTVSSVVLLIVVGFPKISTFPRKYLLVGGLLFVLYELFLSLSIGFANSSSQAIEISMVNYLWPTLTILLSFISEAKRLRLLMLAGMVICLAGVCKVISGSHDFSFELMAENISSNPISYALAFAGAIIWSIYCILTKKIAEGANGITFFFMLTATVLWVQNSLNASVPLELSPHVLINLILVACAIGLGYAAWNIGILHGNVTILATASYFTPVLSALFAAFLLNEPLSYSFWIGASMVSLGSIICWHSSQKH